MFIFEIPRRLRRGQNHGGFQRGRGVALAPLVAGEVSYLTCDSNLIPLKRRYMLIVMILLSGLIIACDAQDRPTISFYLATQRGDLDQFERHLHWQAGINQSFPDGRYPLHVVAEQGKISLLEALLAHQAVLTVRDAAGRTPVESAILHGHIQAAEVLLNAGAAINASGLLLRAAQQGSQDRDVVRFLIRQGADLEVADAAGNTPLLIAIQQHNHRLVAHLLAQGADVDARNVQGQSALSLAQQQQLETIQHSLRRYGASE